MQVEPQLIELAVLRLLRDADARLAYEVLERRWRDTGFRRLDLALTLHALQIDGFLSFKGEPRLGMEVVLLPPGAQRLRAPEWTFAAMQRYLQGLWQMMLVRLRPMPSTNPVARRRKRDLIDPFPARRTADPEAETPWDAPPPYAGERRYGRSREPIPRMPPMHPNARNRKGR